MVEQTVSPTATALPAAVPMPGIVVQVLATAGYGLWMVMGAALALGLYTDGRGEVLAPLLAGLILVSIGLFASILRVPGASEWHGWQPLRGGLPSREGLIAMATYLPMLGVAGLARGNNDFWATRLAGAALLVLSLATLFYTSRNACRRTGVVASMASVVPAGRIVAALLAGGLCFWVCTLLQLPDTHDASAVAPTRLFLLGAALCLGVVDGLRWRALPTGQAGDHRLDASTAEPSAATQRLVAAVLAVGVPCLLLVTVDAGRYSAGLAALAALSSVIGQCLEQRLYCATYAQIMERRR
jgi:DMSO reductase anchor subunit